MSYNIKNITKLYLFGISIILTLLSGCSRSGYYEHNVTTIEDADGIYSTSTKFQDISKVDGKPIKYNPTEVFTISALGNTANTINNSIIELHKYESSDKPKFVENNDPDEDFSKYGLGFLVSIDWVGPIETLVHKVAKIAKFKFKVLGASPPIPVLINVFDKRTSLGDVLRTANLQSKDRADVVIYPKTKTIELRYKAT
tara:strand:- start:123151 stop:123747 length:597 start_codon:yes stop_codon:yes gene_type:complete